jgi:hypothetical protein
MRYLTTAGAMIAISLSAGAMACRQDAETTAPIEQGSAAPTRDQNIRAGLATVAHLVSSQVQFRDATQERIFWAALSQVNSSDKCQSETDVVRFAATILQNTIAASEAGTSGSQSIGIEYVINYAASLPRS